MDEKWKKRKRGCITEEGIYTLLQRYSAKTVLQLLQEVAISSGTTITTPRIDWNEIVKNTNTGITSVREYQMLWRHLAYGQALTDQSDENVNPLDDDSDLEYEAEAFPVVSWDSSMEASACVKALVASDYPIDSHVPNNLTVEAPLTINIPMFKVPTDGTGPANAMHRTNIIIPVSVQKDPISCGTSGEKRPNGKSGADVPPRKKRKAWSTDDDLKLTAAVQKYGEQNWAIIATDVFKNDRMPSELSLRWSSIRKKKGNLNTGTSAELSDAHKAATRAIQLALEPKGNNLKAARQMNSFGTKTTPHQSQIASTQPSNPQLGMAGTPKSQALTERPPINCTTAPPSNPQLGIAGTPKSQAQTERPKTNCTSVPPSNPQLGMAGPPKSQALTERPPINCTTNPTSMIKVAAGASVATRADASSVIKAAGHSQNVVHNSSLTKSSTNKLFSNFSRKSPTKAYVSAFPSIAPILQHSVAKEARGYCTKPIEVPVQRYPVGADIVLDVSSVKANATASIPSNNVKTAEVAGVPTSASGMKDPAQRVQVAGLVNISPTAAVDLISKDQTASVGNLSKREVNEGTSASGSTLTGNAPGDQASISLSPPVSQTRDLQVALPCPGVEDNGKKHGDINWKHANLSCKSLNGDTEASTDNNSNIQR